MNRPFVFTREQRIRKKSDFQLVFKSGKRFSGEYFAVYARQRKEDEENSHISRLGLSTPKRFGNAVFRNRQRRVVRELFRKRAPEFPFPMDVVFVLVKTPAENSKLNADLERTTAWLIQRKPSSVK